MSISFGLVRHGARLACLVLLAALVSSNCGGRGVLRQFEYEEEIYLGLDGSATMIVNASVPALVALRGLSLDPRPSARLDRADLRRQFEGPGVNVTRVSRPWRRRGRRFVQVRLEVDDVRRLSSLKAFSWSDYRLERRDGLVVFRQIVKGADASHQVGDVGWDGSELVGFRMHLPSRIVYHNAPSKEVERGNILSWEQALRDRLAGTPVDIEVRMQGASILRQTLTIFAAAAAAAIALLTAAIWWVWRRGRLARPTAPGPGGAP